MYPLETPQTYKTKKKPDYLVKGIAKLHSAFALKDPNMSRFKMNMPGNPNCADAEESESDKDKSDAKDEGNGSKEE
ncbi:hypothetical protein PCASD_15291 [Puccinia coronata f. sp. avenae]|uniref:Uncharacterized protein n=1 Tax=Puccinia coronata f. sp. avenae TaxID=200324 RepID=A0A2N5UGH6_9BASI|nr:hypothetical protein PCASD_15291 [Puccinia coronata f. sp. avenae]